MSGNGQLSAAELALIPTNKDVLTYGDQYMSAAALPYFLAAAREFREETGQRVYVREGYRSLATQIAIFLARYVIAVVGVLYDGKRWAKKAGQATAAVPGTSIHGFALAVDIWSGIDSSFTSHNHLVWVRVAAKYGWKNTGTGFGEPWHQEWSATRVTQTVASLVTVTHPSPASGALDESSTTTEQQQTPQQEEPMTVLVTSPIGQSLIVGGLLVEPSPGDLQNTSVVNGPALQTLKTTAAVHNRLRLQSALAAGERLIFLVKGSGYALLEDGKFSVVKAMATVNALTRAGVPTVTISADEFDALTKDI